MRKSERGPVVLLAASLVAVIVAVAVFNYLGDVKDGRATYSSYGERSVDGLSEAGRMGEVVVEDGDTFDIEAVPVTKEIGGHLVRMYGYNGEIPGPMIRVKQGSSMKVNFTNSLGFDTTVHWHGLRLDNEFDGVPGVTQEAVRSGSWFLYELKFPDYGVYWYHPHVREDAQQEMGLYGAIIVDPTGDDTYGEADAERTIFLDDIRMSGGDVDEFSDDHVRFALMGRFGNVPFVNGETDYETDVSAGDVVRFHFINSANVRPFNVSIGNVEMKVVGGDSGRYQREFPSKSVVLSPGERVTAEAIFGDSGIYPIVHTTPSGASRIGTVRVSGEKSPKVLDEPSETMGDFPDKDEMSAYYLMGPDREIELSIDMAGMPMGGAGGMDHSMHGGMMGMSAGDIEWEDDMPTMNAASTNDDVRWVIRDVDTGEENDNLVMDVKVGDRMKLRIHNLADSMHPMQHPIHIHGQRFLVLSEDGRMNDNLVWKDVVMVKKGSVVDLLVDFTNPGEWVVHCHIPEHMESGMMSMFRVSG